VTASSCITVAAAEAGGADLFAVELSPGGARVVWPDGDGLLVHTNHFLAAPPRGEDTDVVAYPGTLLRRRHLERVVRAGMEPERALAEHFPAGDPVCRHGAEDVSWADRRETLLAIAADPAVPSLRVAAGPPCRAPFEPVPPP
jgi:isopenicillin-N N-acyltransferase like protein